MSSVFPPFDIRAMSDALTLRLPRDEEIERLALRSKGAILPEGSPLLPWTSAPSPDYERSFLAHHWHARGELRPEQWRLHFGVYPAGSADPVGVQSLLGTDFPVMRSVRTGSWLLATHQGTGIGTLMRTMVLELAFRCLGAREALTDAHIENDASRGVSLRVGYAPNGRRLLRQGDDVVEVEHFRLLASDWAPRPEIEITGIEETIAMLGLGSAGGA